jgi:glyoxylase-like metal-dependent hydrolase (beta-lactamase superfamily II)
MAVRITEVAAGVHRLEDVYTNWYLVEDGGRLTLVDAGLPADWGAFTSALMGHVGRSLADIDAVLITHHHRDHAGNAERLRSSGARVLAHPADAPYLRGEKHLSDRGIVRYLWRPWYAQYILRYIAKGITRTPAVAELEDLADGERLDVPGAPRVIHLPGHTPGSCAILLEDRELLFTGDAIVTLDVVRGPRGQSGPQIVRGPHTEDAARALESLDVLAGTNARVVLPGHGDPWTGGVESAVEHARGT